MAGKNSGMVQIAVIWGRTDVSSTGYLTGVVYLIGDNRSLLLFACYSAWSVLDSTLIVSPLL